MGKKSKVKGKKKDNKADEVVESPQEIHQESEELEYIPLEGSKSSNRQEQRIEEEQSELMRKNLEDAQYDELYPWMEAMNVSFGDRETHASDLLRQEVKWFLTYIRPTTSERELRTCIINKIRNVVVSRWPGAKVEVFGSFATDLYLPNSDLDLVITTDGFGPSLRQVSALMKENRLCAKFDLIDRAAVPVLKFDELESQIKVDIVMNTTNGVHSAALINQMIQNYPGARSLILIVKYYLAQCKLNEVFKGGMSGYAIVCLVVSFLQIHPLAGSGRIVADENMSTLLLDFMKLYGIDFAVDCVGIDVRGDGNYFYKEQDRYSTSRRGKEVFCIVDPQDESNDIGKKSFATESALDEFRYAYCVMIRKMRVLEKDLEENKYLHLSPHLVASYRSFSVLSCFMYVLPEFVDHRLLMRRVYNEVYK